MGRWAVRRSRTVCERALTGHFRMEAPFGWYMLTQPRAFVSNRSTHRNAFVDKPVRVVRHMEMELALHQESRAMQEPEQDVQRTFLVVSQRTLVLTIQLVLEPCRAMAECAALCSSDSDWSTSPK